MRRAKNLFLLAVLLLAATFSRAGNSIVWDAKADRVSADVQGERLWPLLTDIAHQTGWHIFLEPGLDRKADVKFSKLAAGEALKKLLGDLNFAFVPQTNEADHLYVFATTMRAATQRVNPVATNQIAVRHVPNELLVKVKPGTDIDALAKSLGAKVVGRNDQLGLYKLQFADAAATDAALATLKNNSEVAQVEYNNLFDPPPAPQKIATAPVGPVSLTLNPPPDNGGVIIGLVDTALQPSGTEADKLLLKQISIAGEAGSNGGQLTHGESMLETLAQGLAAQGGVSARVVAADIYGNGETATTWNLMLGLQAVVNNGANVVSLSLGGTTDSPMLDDFMSQLLAKGIVVFAATGNNGANTVNFPAALNGVIAVAAKQGNQLAPYSNYGAGTALALPGASVVYLNGQAFLVQGTSPATAFAAGVAAGSKSNGTMTWAQILASMQKQFPVPAK
jgi:thermitase